MRGLQGAMDHFNHCVELLQDLGIPKAKYPVPLALKESRPPPIFLEHLGMLLAIEFDHQPTLHTAEIGHERWDRVLPANLGASALPAAEAVPQSTFGVGLIVAKATSVCRQPRHGRRSEMVSPHPHPLPASGAEG